MCERCANFCLDDDGKACLWCVRLTMEHCGAGERWMRDFSISDFMIHDPLKYQYEYIEYFKMLTFKSLI